MAYALFLAGSNFALWDKEVSDVRHEDYDFETMMLDSEREKDGFRRVASIWSETKAAIKSYMKSDEYSNHSEFLFTDHNGKLRVLLSQMVTTSRFPLLSIA